MNDLPYSASAARMVPWESSFGLGGSRRFSFKGPRRFSFLSLFISFSTFLLFSNGIRRQAFRPTPRGKQPFYRLPCFGWIPVERLLNSFRLEAIASRLEAITHLTPPVDWLIARREHRSTPRPVYDPDLEEEPQFNVARKEALKGRRSRKQTYASIPICICNIV